VAEVQIKWYGHACFRLQAGEVSVITDPFTPETSGLHPVTDTATFVIRSSNDDDFHCNAEMIPGHPKILDAVALAADGGYVADGLRVTAFDTMESVNKEDPRANAMYRLELGGLRVLHLGDLGNPFSDSQLRELAGEVDVILALAGGPPTIELDDLVNAIAAIGPLVVIPMHYRIPRIRGSFLPVTDFLGRYDPESIRTTGSTEIELSKAALPAALKIIVLDPSC
jgi:L-ascorbate metabolism protein UlaG (beta-lactamase superfamily)